MLEATNRRNQWYRWLAGNTASHTARKISVMSKKTSLTHERRKANVERIIREDFGGNQAHFGRAVGKSPSQVNQWIHDHRGLGEKITREIETALNLTPGELDKAQIPGDTASSDAERLESMLWELTSIEQRRLDARDFNGAGDANNAKASIARLLARLQQESDEQT
jgi:DNA-binding transcriptional regulator YdaS (Cro superfamily)